MDKKCLRCGMFDRFYTKAIVCFLRSDYGYCRKNRELLPVDSKACEKWRSKIKDMARRRRLIISELGKVACNIDAIRQLLEFDEEE